MEWDQCSAIVRAGYDVANLHCTPAIAAEQLCTQVCGDEGMTAEDVGKCRRTCTALAQVTKDCVLGVVNARMERAGFVKA